jgi:hypothetical protein
MQTNLMDVVVPLASAEQRLRAMSNDNLKAVFRCITTSGCHKEGAPLQTYWWQVLQSIAGILAERQAAALSAAAWSSMKKEAGHVSCLPVWGDPLRSSPQLRIG